MRFSSHDSSCVDVLFAMVHALKTLGEVREGASNVASALDDHQKALDDVRMRNEGAWREGAVVADLSEEDWQTWDCCQSRMDAIVETCRNLGYETSRDQNGAWHVVFDCRR